ncbi:MAG TPA: serine hydrolase domain-containing protein, partial [Actinopolymorphaceae bacterium]
EAIPDGAGGTVLAAKDGDIVLAKGFGRADREAGTACRIDTVYDIGSLTKQFTAAAILALDESGALAVTDPMRRFVSGVPADKRTITLHHLLTHTAGLADVLGGDYDVCSRSDLVAAALASPLRFSPGEGYAYSNVGYSLLAAVIELVTGEGYETVLADRLFEPAGMHQTGYVRPFWRPGRVAVEYDEDGDRQGTPLDRRWADDGPYWHLRGNGGLLSTARDMYRWHVALNDDRVLSGEARRRLFKPYVREEPDGDTFYGYGWVVLPRRSERGRGRIVLHNGGNGRSYAELARFVDDDAMVFWATGGVRLKGEWDLEGLELTEEIGRRLS